MKTVDYIVVGFGLAGMAFCDQLERHHKTFVVVDGRFPSASKVAAGLINPVILKRYTIPWKGEEQFDLALDFFNSVAARLDLEAVDYMPVHKLFASAEDQNNWFEASDKPVLNRFLSDVLLKDTHLVHTPYGKGQVLESVRIQINRLLDAYAERLKTQECYIETGFDYDNLIIKDQYGIEYGDIAAKQIVFAEGFGLKNNPYFNKLPLVGNKGEYLIIKAPKLQLEQALKSTFFIIPLGDDLYKVGATFNWNDKDALPSLESRGELEAYLAKILKCDYEVVDQQAGVRPTTGDRRPLLGRHPQHPQLVLLNGLGTRGTMMAPYLARLLYEHLENGIPLDDTVSISRFPKKF